MINLVMIAKDRYMLTRQALSSLFENNAGAPFNLVVVDDGSKDWRMVRLYQEFMADHANMAVLYTSGDGVLSRVKNLGVWYAERFWGRGTWLGLFDNDVWFAPESLDKLVDVAERYPDVSLWGGQVHPFHRPIEAHVEWQELEVLDGPSWLMRWETWDKFGPLTGNAPGPCQSEEYPFCQALRASGGRIGVTVPHVVVHTGLTNSNGELAPGAADRRPLIPQGVLSE